MTRGIKRRAALKLVKSRRTWLVLPGVLLLLFVGGLLYLYYGIIKDPETSVALVTKSLQGFFKDADILIEDVEVYPFEGLAVINRLRIRESQSKMRAAGKGQFLDVRQVRVLFVPGSLTEIAEVRLIQPTVHITRDQKGQWNFERLIKVFEGVSGKRGRVPVVQIVGGRLVYRDAKVLLAGQQSSLEPIQLRIDSPPGAERIEFHGTFSGYGLGLTKLSGYKDYHGGGLSINVQPVDSIRLQGSHPLIDKMIPTLRQNWELLGARKGSIFGSVRFTKKTDKAPMNVQLDLTLQDVTLAPGDLPEAIEGVTGRLVYRDGKFSTPRPLRATLAGVPLIARAEKEHLVIESDRPDQMIRIDQALARRLERLTGLPLDSQLRIEGQVAARVYIPLPGSTAEARLSLRNGWVRFSGMADVIEQVHGDLVLGEDEQLRFVNCAARYRGQPIYLQGGVLRPGADDSSMSLVASLPQLDLSGASPVRIEVLRDRWTAANPSGQLALTVRISKQPGQTLALRHELTLTDVALTYEKLRVTQINGQVTANASAVQIGALSARLPEGLIRCTGGSLPLDGEGPLSLALEFDRVELSNTVLGVLPEAPRKRLIELGLAGWLSGKLALKRDRQGRFSATGRVSPNAIRLRYKGVPIRIPSGVVVLAKDRLRAEKLALLIATSSIELNGWIETVENPHGDLTIKANPLGLDPSLIPLIPQKDRRLFVDISPDVTLIGWIRVQLKGADSPRVTGRLRITGGMVRPRDFPLPLRQVRGEIVLDGPRVELIAITGRNGDTRARASGVFETVDGQPAARIEIRGTDVPFGETTRQCLEPKLRRIYDQYDPRGKIDLHLLLLQKPGGKMELDFLRLQPRGHASLRFFAFPYPLTGVSGELEIRDKRVLFQNMKGTAGTASVEVNGIIVTDEPHDLIDIWIRATGARTDAELLACLPHKARKMVQIVRPSGEFNIRCRLLRRNPQDPELSPIVHVTPIKMTVRLELFDYPLELTSGQVEISKHLVHFRQLVGRHGKSRLTLNGKIRSVTRNSMLPMAVALPLASAGMSAPTFLKDRLDLVLETKRLTIDKALLAALAQYIGNKPASLGLGGELRDLKVSLEGYLADKNRLGYKLSGRLVEGALEPGVKISGVQFDFEGSGTIGDETHTGRGSLRKGALKLAGVQATDLSLHWSIIDRYLTIKDLTGKVYDGKLTGRTTADLSKLGAFEAAFRVEQVDLTKLGKEVMPKKALSGKLTAGIELEGIGGDSARLVGKGGAYIKDGNIWKLPLFLGLTEVFDLKQTAAFNKGRVEFKIRNKQLIFDRIEFRSAPIWLRGKGTMDFGGNLDVTLTTWFAPETIPRIPIVDRLWRKVKRNFFPVKITGTLRNPDVSLRPFNFVQRKSPR